ncbi:unnamed protein product, partial [marine sediment metagenome]
EDLYEPLQILGYNFEMISLNRKSRMIFFGIIIGTLTLTSWALFSIRELSERSSTPVGDIINLPEPQLQGMSLEEALMRAYLTTEFSNYTYAETTLRNSSSHQIISY